MRTVAVTGSRDHGQQSLYDGFVSEMYDFEDDQLAWLSPRIRYQAQHDPELAGFLSKLFKGVKKVVKKAAPVAAGFIPVVGGQVSAMLQRGGGAPGPAAVATPGFVGPMGYPMYPGNIYQPGQYSFPQPGVPRQLAPPAQRPPLNIGFQQRVTSRPRPDARIGMSGLVIPATIVAVAFLLSRRR